MNKLILTLVVIVLSYYAIYAQKHDYIWAIGYGDSPSPFGSFLINNHTLPLSIDTTHHLSLEFDLATCTFSDSSGNLLFYTNGDNIMDKSFQLMQNGDGLNPNNWPGINLSPIAFYLPSEENSSYIYIFHTNYDLGDTLLITAKTLSYTVINLSLNNGLGKVITKNQILLEGDLIPICATKHGNGRDWWIMTAQKGNEDLYSYLLSSNGISGPFIQTFEMDSFLEDSNKNIFSPDGNYYLRTNTVSGGNSILYDFDRCSGLVSNRRVIPSIDYAGYPLTPWYSNFSPDERFLYCNRQGAVWSYDLESTDLLNTHYIVSTWELNYYPYFPAGTGYFTNNISPDGKIYIAGGGYGLASSQSLSIVHRPELPAESCNIEEEAIHFPRWFICFTAIDYPNYRLGKWLDSPCDTLSGAGAPGFKDIPYSEEKQVKRQQLAQAQIASQLKYLENRKTPPPTRKRNNIWEVKSFDDIQSPMHWLLLRKRWEETGNYPDWAKQVKNEVKNK